jgi:hypothetical protein
MGLFGPDVEQEMIAAFARGEVGSASPVLLISA